MRILATLAVSICMFTASPVLANDFDLPAWAEAPPPPTRSNDMPPPTAAAPGLPGPPSMPLPGFALLALAGGALAFHKLRANN